MSGKNKESFLGLYEKLAALHNDDVVELYDRITRKIEKNVDAGGIARDLKGFVCKFNGEKETSVALMIIFLLGFRVGEFLTKMRLGEIQPAMEEKKENAPELEVIFDLTAIKKTIK